MQVQKKKILENAQKNWKNIPSPVLYYGFYHFFFQIVFFHVKKIKINEPIDFVF